MSEECEFWTVPLFLKILLLEAEILLQIPNALVLREVRVYDREELGISRLSDNHHFGFIDSLCDLWTIH